MRLIDGDEVKKVIEDSVSQYGGQYSADMLNMWALFSHIINDAPTVEITEEQAIDKLHDTGWLPLHDKEMTERPHGEWLHPYTTGVACECSICHVQMPTYRFYFCPNCGAEMGKEEKDG